MRQKKGQLGLDVVKSVMLILLTIGVIAVAVILALTSLNDSNIFTAGSIEQNYSNSIQGNISSGATDFFDNIPTIFTILGVVAIIAAIALILFFVNRFGREGGGL